MYNRTLNRPMFRRGGRAGGGIMTGVQRQGYQGTDNPEDSRVKKLDTETAFLQKAIGERPEIKPYPYKGSDFFMGLGANILSAPGGNPILQTIGQSSRGPLEVMMKQNIADYGNKQKSELGKYQDRRDLIMATYKNLSEEDKDALINRAEQMVKAGRFETIEEALQILVPTYRKDQSPEESEREDLLRVEKNKNSAVENIEKTYEIGTPDAIKLHDFQKDIINDMTASAEDKKYKLPYDGDQYYIDNDDVGRKPIGDSDKRLVIRNYDPEQSDYRDGIIYLDFETNTVFVKQGQYFIPYEDYISKTISTK
jgi:hypothetical protein